MSASREGETLTRSMTWEEERDLVEKIGDALGAGDRETASRLVRRLPLRPEFARRALEWKGREYCEKHFNLFAANREFGEGWMDKRCDNS